MTVKDFIDRAMKYGVDRQTAENCLQALIHRGLVEVKEK
jgi:hypothetical protein